MHAQMSKTECLLFEKLLKPLSVCLALLSPSYLCVCTSWITATKEEDDILVRLTNE